MGRFDSLLSQVSDGGRFSSVLDKVDDFGWEEVSPVLQRRRKPAGGYEYRPSPARGQGAPGVGVVGEDPREKAIREAQARTSMSRPESVPEQVMDQLKPRVAAGVVSMPELPSAAQGIAQKLNPGMRPRRPLPPGTSPTELLNPRTLYPEAVKAPVERVYSEREAAAQALARKMTEAGVSPEVSAAADLGLEVAAMALDPTNALPGIGLLGKVNRGARILSGLPDAALSREASLAAQLPEAPVAAPRTRGAATLDRALGREEIVDPAASGRRPFGWKEAMRQGDSFPPDLDGWIRGKGLDPDRMGVKEKGKLYGRMVAEEKAPPRDLRPDIVPDAEARVFRVGDKEFPTAWQARSYRETLDPETGAPPPELTRERWEEIKNLPASRLAAGNRLVEEGLAKPSEVGALRIGSDPVRADPATEAFRASVFQEQPARPPIGERLREVKDKLLAEFSSASNPYTSRMAKAGAGDVAETNALELRRAGHTALQPITYATRRWDPSVKQWEYTGEPLEAWTARMDEATQRQVEAVMTAESQVEWAGHHADEADPARTMESAQYLGAMAPERARLQPHLDAARAYMDRAFIQPLERLGVFSPEQAAEIRAKNQHYSYMMRADDILGPELRSGEAVATKSSPVKRREAGLVEDGKLVPPIEAIAMQAARTDKFQVRQMVRNDLAERVVQSPDLFPELMPAKVGEAGTFVAWKDGKQYAIKAPGDLLDVIDNIRPEQSSYVWRAARVGASALRTLATLAPHFPGMNFLRDQATAAVFSRSKKLFGFVPYYSPAKELVKEIAGKVAGRGGSRAWKDFQASPAGHSTFLRADREGMSRAVKEARMRATSRGRTALKVREAANPLFVPATVGNALESATRIAERELLLREGAGAREATTGAAKVSLDFSDGGRFTKKVNEVVAFLNVRFLDPARFLREIKKRPFTIAARATAFITLPALAEEWFHKDDPGYHNLPLWDQVAFYHVGRSTEGIAEGWYKRIPRPLGLVSYIFGLLPQLALRQQLKDDPHAADLAMRGLLQDTPAGLMFSQDEQGGLEPSMEAVPTIARGGAELIANRKWTGAPVVPDPNVPVEQQYTDRTSPFVRELAGALPNAAPDFLQSPQQLEHLISAQTAGTGRLALDVVNPLVRKATGEAEPPREPLSPRDIPIVRSFVSPPPEGFESLVVDDVYKFAARVDALDDLLRKVEDTDPARVRILEAVYPEIEAAGEVREVREQLGIWRREREEIKAAKIPDQLKRARLRRLDKEVTAYAEDWMKGWRKLYPQLLQ